MIKNLCIGYIMFFVVFSCDKKNNKKPIDTPVNKNVEASMDSKVKMQPLNREDAAEEWLKNIFKTKKSDRFFPEYNVEQELCTKRFQEFISETNELYGPSNLSDEEYPNAEKKI